MYVDISLFSIFWKVGKFSERLGKAPSTCKSCQPPESEATHKAQGTENACDPGPFAQKLSFVIKLLK